MPYGGVLATQFIIRSNTGDGSRNFPEIRKGQCVEDGDKIHIQANNLDSRWINGSRLDGTFVFSRDIFRSDYESTAAFKNYVWSVHVDES